MKIKTLLCCSLALACALSVSAQRRSSSRSGGAKTAREAAQEKMDAKVKISQMPNIGPQSLLVAPGLQAQGGSQPITKSRRQWGVYEMTYRTAQKWTEDLTVNWFVLCDTKKAKQVDRSKTAARLPPYVYYTLVSRYVTPYASLGSTGCRTRERNVHRLLSRGFGRVGGDPTAND